MERPIDFSPGRHMLCGGCGRRFLVDLDAGARLVVVAQNVQTGSSDVARMRETEVTLRFNRQHVVAVQPGREQPVPRPATLDELRGELVHLEQRREVRPERIPLLQALDGASSTSTTNSDGSTTTSLTYADGSKVTMTSGPTASASTSAASSYNFIEQMIQRAASSVASSASSSLSMNV